jgi:hypothetical protein
MDSNGFKQMPADSVSVFIRSNLPESKMVIYLYLLPFMVRNKR